MSRQDITEIEVLKALLDDANRQLKVRNDELRCAGKLLGKPMLSVDVETLRKKWALLIGDDE